MNKYASNLRTFTARNLVWNGATPVYSAGPALPLVTPRNVKALAAPAAIVYNSAVDNQLQFFRANNNAGQTEWNIDGNIMIKRLGLFSNLADGLIFNTPASRLILEIRAAIFTINLAPIAATVTAGSADISGVAAGLVNGDFVADSALTYSSNYYRYHFDPLVYPAGSARLSDYALRSSAALYKVTYNPAKLITVALRDITSLNALYESEFFINISTSSLTSTILFLAQLLTDGAASYSLRTDTVDTALNTMGVTFDACMELEVTPNILLI